MNSAYMICTHGSFNLLKRLICQLDCPENDIYIHIDKKVKDVDFDEFETISKFSKVVCLRRRVSVIWGHITQPQVAFMLLEAACLQQKYDYYHLISGVDFPIKSNEYINEFLTKHKGKEFVGFIPWDASLDFKFGFYHIIPHNLQNKYIIIKKINQLILKFQKIVHIRHFRDTHTIYKGCNWWSITHQLAVLLINNKEKILRKYRFTSCSDEVFVQSFIAEHPDIMKKVYNFQDEYCSCLRYIDWNRGTPYTFSTTDYDTLMKSTALFARKFSENDTNIIDKIEHEINKETNQ